MTEILLRKTSWKWWHQINFNLPCCLYWAFNF
jgi:hypothetical protein